MRLNLTILSGVAGNVFLNVTIFPFLLRTVTLHREHLAVVSESLLFTDVTFYSIQMWWVLFPPRKMKLKFKFPLPFTLAWLFLTQAEQVSLP